MPRSTEEWVGKTADSPVPGKVWERLWRRCDGYCQGCGLNLADQAWDVDHKIAEINWVKTPEQPHGNRESNLQVLGCKCCHRPKTKEDMKIKARTSRWVRHHTGIKKRTSRHRWGYGKNDPLKKKVDGTVVPRGRAA